MTLGLDHTLTRSEYLALSDESHRDILRDEFDEKRSRGKDAED